jgi:hypothetical protein
LKKHIDKKIIWTYCVYKHFNSGKTAKDFQMKNNSFLILGMSVMVLALGLVLSGCATQAPSAEMPSGGDSNNEEKTIVITGFNLPMDGIEEIKVDLTGDWVDEQEWWIIPANCVAKVDGQTLTAWLYFTDSDERWTGTGEYGINIFISSATDETVKVYRYGYNTGSEGVTIKDAETTLEWSDFVFAWDD